MALTGTSGGRGGKGEIEEVMLGKYRAVVEGNEDYMAVLHCTHVQSSQA